MIRRLFCFFLFLFIPALSSCREAGLKPANVTENRLEAMFRISGDSFPLVPFYDQLLQDCLNFPLLAANKEAVRFFKDGEEEKAFRITDESISINPRYYNSYFVKAGFLLHRRDYASALLEYNKLAEILPEVPWVFYYRGLIYEKLNNSEQLLSNLKRAVSLRPALPEPYAKLGDILFDSGEFREAGILFSEAISKSPQNPEYYSKRGSCYFRRGAEKAALQDFSKALKWDPANSQAHFLRALLYKDSGKYLSALSDLEALSGTQTDEAEYLALRAELDFLLGAKDQARTLFNLLVSSKPQYIDDYLKGNHFYRHNSDFVKRFFFSPENPLRILLAGDSMAGGGLNFTLMNITSPYDMINLTTHYKVSSGLTNTSFYDWKSVIQELLADGPFDLIIVILGTNDAQNMMNGTEGLRYGTKRWFEVYESRVRDFLNILSQNATKVYWIGLPPMNPPVFHSRMHDLNTIYETCSRERDNVKFISTFELLGTKDQKYVEFVEVNGVLKRTRAVDNIHFTMDGIRPLGNLLSYMIREDFFVYKN